MPVAKKKKKRKKTNKQTTPDILTPQCPHVILEIILVRIKIDVKTYFGLIY